MRKLVELDVSDPRSLIEPLRKAIFDGGPAIMPLPRGSGQEPRSLPFVEDEIAIVVQSSGTTGPPKRVAITADALLANAKAGLEQFDASGGWLQLLPSHYIAGIQVAVRSMLGGVPFSALHPKNFSIDSMVSKFSDIPGHHFPLYTSMVPAQLHRTINVWKENRDFQKLMRRFGHILVGGQLVSQDLLDQARDLGLRVTSTYGSTETSGGCVWNAFPIGDTQVAEFDGRIAISGPALAHSYLEDPDGTAKSFVQIGSTRWFMTDDFGSISKQGRLTVHGRLDDLIISGGVKVNLAEVEKVVRRDFSADEAVVVPSDHVVWGQVPVLVTNADLDLQAVRRLVGEVLGPESRPERVVKVAKLPYLISGKPDRLLLSKLVREGRT